MKRRTLFALVAAGVAAWIGCSGSPPEKRSKSVTLGAILPLTGDVASYGKAAKRGIDLAVDEVNARGGVDGRTVSVVYEDDQGQASKAIAAMKKLVDVDGAPLVMGSAASSVTLALCPIAERQKVVLITPISSSKELTEKGGAYFFRVCPSDAVQATMMADWLGEDGHKTAAVVYVNNSWGQGLRDEFVARFAALGGKVVAEEACKEGDRDLRAQLTKVKAAAPDALYVITYGKEGGALLRQAKELALGQPIYGADVWGSPELAETAQDAAKGVKIIVPAQFEGKKYDEFAKRFEDRFGESPDTYASYSYDMFNLVCEALAQTEERAGDVLRNAVASISYEGVTGVTNFDRHGDVVGKGFARKVLP